MIRLFLKRSLAALIMLFIFFLSPAVYGEPVSDILSSMLNADFPYTADVSFQFDSLPPYSKDRLSAFNQLLDHYSFHLCDNGVISQIILCCDDEQVFSADFTGNENQNKMYFSFDPKTIWLTDLQKSDQSNDTDIQSGTDSLILKEQGSIIQSSLYDLLPGENDFPYHQVFELLQNISIRFNDRMKESKIKTKIKNAGTATLKKTLSISKDEAEQGLLQDILSDCSDSSLKNKLGGMEFIGKQQYVFFYNDLGNIIKTSYSGQILYSENRSKISFDWTTNQAEQRYWDEVHLSCAPVKGKNRYTLTMTKEEIMNESDSEMHYLMSDTYNDGKTKITNQKQADLFYKDKITGTIFLEKKNKEGVQSLQLEPDIKISAAGNWEGKAGMIYHHEDISPIHVLLSIKMTQGCDPFFPEENSDIQLKLISEETKDAFTADLQRKLAVCILKSMLLLPEEDLAFINHEIDEESWKTILTLVDRK